jgi:3-deoxy-D-manno-octulosonic-acid transferase
VKDFLIKLIYNLLFTLLFLLTSPYSLYRLLRRGRLFNYHFLERLAQYNPKQESQLKHGCDFWIHAVSVGEVLLARALLRELRARSPHLRIVITTTTPTGHQLALPLQDEHTLILFTPFDFYFTQLSAFKKIRPKAIHLIEAEIWPNMLWIAASQGIPVTLINARLSERTAARYQKFSFFIRPLLEKIDHVFAQDTSDIARLIKAGFPKNRIHNFGSMKYDVAALPWQSNIPSPALILEQLNWNQDDPIILAASTHPGEEAMITTLWQSLHAQMPNLKLILAPRHAERGRAILDFLRSQQISTATLRTQIHNNRAPHTTHILILDTTGELRSWFTHATIVIMGKSFKAHGGQNFIEAAQAGKPIILGPHMENFLPQTRAFLDQEALIQVASEEELLSTLNHLLQDPTRAQTIGKRARAHFEASCGAAAKTAAFLLESKNLKKRF